MAEHTPQKRVKLTPGSPTKPEAAVVRLQRSAFLSSLTRSISPPNPNTTAVAQHGANQLLTFKQLANDGVNNADPYQTTKVNPTQTSTPMSRQKLIPSPFQLTKVRDLPDTKNIDTVSIKDILGDVMIKEAWIFNFLFDVDWIMHQFDRDVRKSVSVKLIHGFWKRDDENRANIYEACGKYPHIAAEAAYMKDPFGTHHTKMIILFRRDDTAQVIIHTANMIPKDWTNMTNAVWRSPLLPMFPLGDPRQFYKSEPLGTGPRFKEDLLRYLKAYEKHMNQLLIQLKHYDFSAVRGVLVGSVPSAVKISEGGTTTRWGWLGLQDALEAVGGSSRDQDNGNQHLISKKRPFPSDSGPSPDTMQLSSPQAAATPERPHIVSQVSSIASLHKSFLPQFFATMRGTSNSATFSIIFPTAPDVRQSLDGYASGNSIHTKIEKAPQLAQVETLRPYLSHWSTQADHAGRSLAAPHIKTYIRYSSSPSDGNTRPDIDWALLTSANLSVQAWGTVPALVGRKGKDKDKEPEVRISSFELGVLIWPGLYSEEDVETSKVRLVPAFGQDLPERKLGDAEDTLVGLRMPYDLPLAPYGAGEMPWAVAGRYAEPDRFNQTWPPRRNNEH